MHLARICTPNVYHENVHKPTFYVYLYIHSMYTSMYILCTPPCTFHIHSIYIPYKFHCAPFFCVIMYFPEKCLLIHSRTIGLARHMASATVGLKERRSVLASSSFLSSSFLLTSTKNSARFPSLHHSHSRPCSLPLSPSPSPLSLPHSPRDVDESRARDKLSTFAPPCTNSTSALPYIHDCASRPSTHLKFFHTQRGPDTGATSHRTPSAQTSAPATSRVIDLPAVKKCQPRRLESAACAALSIRRKTTG